MNSYRRDLEAEFQRLSDDELLSRGGSGGLTELAQSIASIEAQSRGIQLPPPPIGEEEESKTEYCGDMQIVARYLTPTEAHMLCSCLHAGGVPAEAGNTNFVQANTLLAGAVGGACLRVPATYVAEAQEVIAAFRRGEFQLGDDFDVGE